MESEIEMYCDPRKLPNVAEMEKQFDKLRHAQCIEHGKVCGVCGYMDCKYYRVGEVIEDV